MGSILTFPRAPHELSLREQYAIKLHNAINYQSGPIPPYPSLEASCLMGYLGAASTAFRITGDETAACLCENVYEAIDSSTHDLTIVLMRLVLALDPALQA